MRAIRLQISRAKPGNPKEGGREGMELVHNRQAKPGNQLVGYKLARARCMSCLLYQLMPRRQSVDRVS